MTDNETDRTVGEWQRGDSVLVRATIKARTGPESTSYWVRIPSLVWLVGVDQSDLVAASSSSQATAVGERDGWQLVPPKVLLLLAMMDSAGGEIDATDDGASLLNYFCNDVEPTDTFNQAINLKLIRTTFHDTFETSEALLTDKGRAMLAASHNPAAPEGGK